MSILHYDDYKKFVVERTRRGEYQKMALALRVHPTLISQVFRGERDLTPEQASSLASHFNMSEVESDYFLCLVQRSRAGNQEFRQILQRRIDRLRSLKPFAEDPVNGNP